MTNNMRKLRRYTDAQRQQHLADWKNSGLVMSEYCKNHDVSISSLSVWNKACSRPTTKELKPIATKSHTKPLNKQRPIEVVTLRGIKIRLSDIDQLPIILNIINEDSKCS